jgi:Tol biopolymer transport system component
MSRVFVATDVELDRQVVVKVLPPDLAAGINTDRFRREIQLAAKLQHPHIVPLLSAGAKGSLLYYTMPFISGENLRARLNRTGELPIQEATRLIREVVDALSYAHSQGVVHRDIKPENILISGNHALVTDFGVSKALSTATSESPAPAHTLTSLGIALGTPAYMAPEQAAADPLVDHRADIYAAGVMAYELLSGSTPFAGLSQQQTLAAHISAEPRPVTAHRPQVPPGLAAAVMRCLEKRPADRWQTAHELHDALEPYAMTSGATVPAAVAPPRRPFQWTPQRIAVAAGALGLLVTGLIVSTLAFRGDGSALAVGNTRQITSAPGLELYPALSPDGEMIVYTTGPHLRHRIFVRRLSGGRAIPLGDTLVSARFPLWSPDGSQIMFRTQGQTWVVPVLGGTPEPVPGLDSLAHCAWSHSGDRLACVHVGDGRVVVSGGRGESPRFLSTLTPEGASFPTWSPDDKLIAFTQGNLQFLTGADIGNLAPSSIWIVPADGGTEVRMTADNHLNTSPVWTRDGAVLFVSTRGGTRDIYLQRLGGDLKPRGEPTRLTTGLEPHTISMSRDGTKLTYSRFTTNANIWTGTIERSAEENARLIKPVTTGNQTIEQGFVSPDGKWLAYDSNLTGNQDIYKMPLDGGEAQQLTRDPADDFFPTWSPDGNEIAFHSMRNGNRDLFIMPANGGDARPIYAGPGEQLAPQWITSGKLIFIAGNDSLMEISRLGSAWTPPRLLFRASGAAWSRDGKRALRVANAGEMCPTCEPGLYVQSADENPQHIPMPNVQKVFQSGAGFSWSSDSRHAYGMVREKDGSNSIWQIAIDGNPERRVFHFTDPSRMPYRGVFDIHGPHFYFTIGDRQSDIWVMDLTTR